MLNLYLRNREYFSRQHEFNGDEDDPLGRIDFESLEYNEEEELHDLEIDDLESEFN